MRVKSKVLMACQMSFFGTSNSKIAEHFGVSSSTVSRWRKLPIWVDFENELLTAYRKAAVEKQIPYTAEEESSAQG